MEGSAQLSCSVKEEPSVDGQEMGEAKGPWRGAQERLCQGKGLNAAQLGWEPWRDYKANSREAEAKGWLHTMSHHSDGLRPQQ